MELLGYFFLFVFGLALTQRQKEKSGQLIFKFATDLRYLIHMGTHADMIWADGKQSIKNQLPTQKFKYC